MWIISWQQCSFAVHLLLYYFLLTNWSKSCKCLPLIRARTGCGRIAACSQAPGKGETVRVRLNVIALVRHTKNHMRGFISPLLFTTLIMPHCCSVRRYYVPFYSPVTFKYLHFCVRIMDLGIETYEVYLIQVAGPVPKWHPQWVPARLADKIIAGIKINNPLHKCCGIMSITPIKVNDVVLNSIYWERGRQQLWHLAFRGEMVNMMWHL